MMRLTGVDILLTYHCTSRCDHCCYRAGPECRQTMTLGEVEGYLSQIADHPLETILLFGGEPFCCFALLRDSVRLAHQVAAVLVFTNGSWATDRPTAEHLLSQLKDAGLDYLLFSVDAFHQAHVPVERIAVGIQAAQALRYSTVAIDNRCVGKPTDDNPFNQRTNELMAWLGEQCDLTDVTISTGSTRMVGRAAETLSSIHCDGSPSGSKCAFPSYLGSSLRSPTGVEIHPGGWVSLCGGLSLGNALTTRLTDILSHYNADAHPIVRILAEHGPDGLIGLVEQHGYQPPDRWVDGCHLCYLLRRHLRPHYPDLLAPMHLYAQR